jgi:protein SCO1/2
VKRQGIRSSRQAPARKARLLLGLAVVAALWLGGCVDDSRPATLPDAITAADSAAALHDHGHVPGEAAPAPMTGMSIYQLKSAWTDQHGATRQLEELRGRPQVIAMVYTNCGTACPLIVNDMKQVEATFPDVGFVLVSIDPERDTPNRLHEFAAGSRLGDRWTLLNGSDEQLLELATVLGVRYRRVSDTDFMHSNVLTVLNAAGEIVYRQEGLGDVSATMGALRTLQAS